MAETQSTGGTTSVTPPTASPPISGFTDADFAKEPLSHKVTHPLPPPSDAVRLRGPNLLKWHRFVESTLRARQLFKHCTAPPLPGTHPNFAAWEAEEHFILNWFVTQTLAPDFIDRFPYQKTVKGFWDQASTFCSQDGDNWHLFELVARAQSLRQGTLTIMEYALAHKSLWDEVDYYLPVDDPLCHAFQHILRIRLLGFLNGLNKEYADIRRRALRNKGGLPTIDSLVKELQEEESSLRVHGTPAVDASHESTALLATPSPPSSASAQPSSAMICSYCGRSGHLRKRCRKRQHDNQQKKNGQEAKAMVAQSAPPPPSTSSSLVEQLQADLARLTAQVTAMHATTPTAFFGASPPSSSHEWYCGQSALTSPLVSDTTWVLDSGATEHMTPFNSRFVSYQRHVGGRPVLTAS